MYCILKWIEQILQTVVLLIDVDSQHNSQVKQSSDGLIDS
jgi:hypothetical protein